MTGDVFPDPSIPRRGLRNRLLNAGHFVDHMMMLIFTTAVIAIAAQGIGDYSNLIALATLGFILFGILSIPFGWLGDRYGRQPIMVVFFIGIGSASILTGLAEDPWQIGLGLSLIGLFGAIYHPVGIPMLVQGLDRPGRVIGVNGVFGNLGVAAAPLATGALIAAFDWRAAFIVPGIVSIILGLAFWRLVPRDAPAGGKKNTVPLSELLAAADWRRVLIIIAIIAAISGIVFNAMTVALPKLFQERPIAGFEGLMGYAAQASLVYALASIAQIASGIAVDRLPARRLLIVLLTLQAIGLMALSEATGTMAWTLALFVMLCVFGQIPIIDTVVTRLVPDALRGRVFSVKYTLNLGLGAGAVPMIAVMHTTETGYAPIIFTLSILAAFLGGIAILLPRAKHAAAMAGAAE